MQKRLMSYENVLAGRFRRGLKGFRQLEYNSLMLFKKAFELPTDEHSTSRFYETPSLSCSE